MRRCKDWAHKIFWKYLSEGLFCQFFPKHRVPHSSSLSWTPFRVCWKSAATAVCDLILVDAEDKCQFLVGTRTLKPYQSIFLYSTRLKSVSVFCTLNGSFTHAWLVTSCIDSLESSGSPSCSSCKCWYNLSQCQKKPLLMLLLTSSVFKYWKAIKFTVEGMFSQNYRLDLKSLILEVIGTTLVVFKKMFVRYPCLNN